MTRPTRLALIADIHCGPDRDTQLGSRAPDLLETFVSAVRAFRPDGVIDLGDRINSVAHGQDGVRTAYVRRRLLETGAPVYHVLGNTDAECLSKNDLTGVLGKPSAYEAVDLDGPRLIVLDSLDPSVDGIGGTIGEAQLDWLGGVLRTPRPCLVCCHHPLDDQPLTGHRYFEARPGLAGVCNRVRVRRLLEQAGNVSVVFAGHMHWTRFTRMAGVPHLTLGSLVDGAYTDGEPGGTYAFVTIDDQRIEISIAGRRPERVLLTLDPIRG
jgi:3',5'-cyclic-AMP phosphodiesterase